MSGVAHICPRLANVSLSPLLYSCVLSHCSLLPPDSLSERRGSRKNYKEAEANALLLSGERPGLLPAPDAARVRAQLRK